MSQHDGLMSCGKQVSRGAASFAPSANSSICEEKTVAIPVMAETGANVFYKRCDMLYLA